MENKQGLQKQLKTRHITMISLGGIIGAGLFVGAGAVVRSTGPAAVVSYAFAGLLVVFLMRMLGEMAARNPDSGSFATYAREAIGSWAGFTIGWLYWFFWVIVIAIEAVAGGAILHEWVPGIPIWIWSLVLTFLLTLTNIFSVKSFAEFEYWFALIKIVAITVFMGIGIAIILHLFPSIKAPGTSNLIGHGGFIPKGPSSIFLGVATVIFSYFGAEIAAIAAGESENPQKTISIAIKSVVWRILLFYIGSVAILVTLLPWDSTTALKSPYVTLLDMIGIPGAGTIMNAVVLTSVLSCLNSALYTNSRMIYSLAQRGDAPKAFLKLSKNGVPVRAVWAGTVVAFIAAIFNFISPDKVFQFLVNASGAIALLVYLAIVVSHIILRRRATAAKETLTLKMWLFPGLSYFVIFAIAVILISMAFIDSMKSQLYLTILLTAAVILSYFLFGNRSKQSEQTNSLKG
ncbi:GABA permease [Fictibacillus macauensis ZFHKF-1]|uniref:GABA permease n=1 Tax=Fictibacillus macauensis ZFHKF-1 TaxID=1196324 RepID=I8AN69_9BACL|nr:amino acid permease [Fictibacillus macauensis]EIT87447.1 GABA permease [Fictibacillus macauensis ZFHKF-1]